MKLNNLKSSSNFEVERWLSEKLELTPYQKDKMRRDEIVRFSKFKFFERKERVNNPLLRLTIIFVPIVWLLLVCILPFKFLIFGRWGYESKDISWYQNWTYSLGL